MEPEFSDRQELERSAQVLANQTERLIHRLGVDVSGAETFSKYSPAFRQAADTYERLALAEKRTKRVKWERTTVDGRDGAYLMKCLWEVREKLRAQDEVAV